MVARMICAASVSLFLFVSGPAAAQEEDSLVQVVTVKVRPGANAQFEEFVRAFREASRQQGLENYWLAAEAVSGEPTYTFSVAMSGWGNMANPGPQFVEAFGEEEAMRLDELAKGSIESVHTAFYETQADLSVPPPQMDAAPAAVVYYNITLNPGMAQQYAEMSRQTREASLAVTPDSYYLVQTPSFGANGVRVVGIVESWSDLGTAMPPGQRVIRHFGEEEGGEIVAMANEAISGISATLNRTRPDLNYQPEG